ncbi:MAG: hypothetical protein DRZ79_00625 [Candidatus Cloacimonadota bacterium]|nr:MAG: hypothetical protein DRZ79_00625 [Candidatus Cloacimonadota bacterium]
MKSKKTFAIVMITGMLGLSSCGHTIVYVHKPPPAKAIVEIKPTKPYPKAVWIPGHWKWSKKRQKYIWVKGHWKKVKKEKTWIAGHWKKTPYGWIWINGHWN